VCSSGATTVGKLAVRCAVVLAVILANVSYSVFAAEPPMSSAFERFKCSFFEDPKSAQDALDTVSLASLAGDERAQAEQMLIAFLPDSRAVIGLGVLRSKKAGPELKRLFDAALKEQAEAAGDAQRQLEYNALGLVYLARALWLIEPDPRWPVPVIGVLNAGYYWMQRQEAAEVLAVMPTPEAAAALTRGLDDTEDSVRFSAARSLLTLYGLPVPPMEPQSVTIQVMSADPARHDAAKRDLLAAIAGRAIVGQ
jgi:hypothetical protein